MLAVGGNKNTLGRAEEVVELVLNDQDRLAELFACLDHDDAWLRMRAIDAIEKVCRVQPDWLEPFKSRIFGDLLNRDQPSLQWHLAEMFVEMGLTAEQQSQAIQWLRDKLSTTSVDWIVAGNCMSALSRFVRAGKLGQDELGLLLTIQQQHHSKVVSKRATKLMAELK